MTDRRAPRSQPADRPRPVGIVSGTGQAGVALAARLAVNGQPVVVGSRIAERSEALATTLLSDLGGLRPNMISGGTNLDAAACELVILATNAQYITEVVREIAPALDAKIVVSMAALIRPGERGSFRPDPPATGSIAIEVAELVPTARVVAALQHAPAKEIGRIDTPFTGDVLVCGDDGDAVQLVCETLGPLSSGSFLDAGGLANAVAIEAMTSVLVSLNIRYHNRFSLRLLPATAVQS